MTSFTNRMFDPDSVTDKKTGEGFSEKVTTTTTTTTTTTQRTKHCRGIQQKNLVKGTVGMHHGEACFFLRFEYWPLFTLLHCLAMSCNILQMSVFCCARITIYESS